MKFKRRFKIILYSSLFAMYGSGILVWIFENWFQIDQGFGPGPRHESVTILHVHSVFGLWFLILFGHLFQSHIQRGWRLRQKVKSGIFLVIPLIVLIGTIPGLFYLTDEKWKSIVSQVHTFIGIATVLPFFLHYLTRRKV